jgi:LuxR family quorum sensing-dependent transcriptional regulator
MTILSKHQELARSLGNIRTVDGLKEMLNNIAEEFDVNKFAVTSIPPTASKKLSDHVLCGNLSPNFLAEYDNQEMLQYSTHFEAMRHTSSPRIWRIDMEDKFIAAETDENMIRTREMLSRNKITMGCSFPAVSTQGDAGVVIFMGDRSKLDEFSIAYLNVVSSYAYEFLSRLQTPKSNNRQSLTKRECEILSWVSVGKTSSEIAQILSVSDHTINTHLHSAMKKMDCVNRTQLVANAIRLGIIQ